MRSRRSQLPARIAPHVPEPPVPLPEGRIVHVPGRGEFFLRDSGGAGPAVLLLHGWMFASDMNWWPVYGPLRRAGLRVLAMDHRGHGRGLRTREPFSLEACAGDAAALIDYLGCAPVTAVGYSMGGPIAQLLARHHRDKVCGLVLCATTYHWGGPRMWAIWQGMGALRLGLGVAPLRGWDLLLAPLGLPEGPHRSWLAAELTRGSSVDIAEGGRELGRYDARPWIARLRDLPSAVVVTARDRSVPPRKQRALAAALGAARFEVEADHIAVISHREAFAAALIEALAAVGTPARAAASVA